MALGSQILAAPRSTPTSDRLTDFPELGLFVLNRRVQNCQTRTVETYQEFIGRFLRFTGKPVKAILKSDVELYLLSLQEKGRSPHYVRSCYRNLHVFFSWLVAEEMIDRSPMRGLKPPRLPRYAKDFLREEDFRKMQSLCPRTTFCGARNAAWLWLLWSTGCRVDELAKLKLSDLDWTASTIRVIGKGAKERRVPFTQPAQRAVYQYLKMRNDHHCQLWISEERQPMQLTGLGKITRTMFDRAEVKVKDLHHVFRRTWAYRNLKAGVPLKFVQLVGGWESVSVLEQYVRRMDSEDALGSNVGWQ
jgi:site-specific recombinase XerD